MFLSAFAELMSIGAVIPFIGVITDPESLTKIALVQLVVNFFDVEGTQELILFFTFIFISLVITAGLIRVLYVWTQSRLTHFITADLSVKAFRNSLYQPYSVHVNRNSSEVISTIFVKLNKLSYRIILNVFVVCSSIIIIATVFCAFLYVDFLRTLLLFLAFASIYLFFTLVFKNALTQGSKIQATEQDKSVKILQESFGGIRDVLIDGTHELYIKLFAKSEVLLRKTVSLAEFMALSPRYIIEMFGMSVFAIFCTFSVYQGIESSTLLPVLGAVVVAAVKLLPYVQATYAGVSDLRAHSNLVEDVLELLEQQVDNTSIESLDSNSQKKISLQDRIEFDNLSFSYPGANEPVLKNITLDIPAGSKVGIIGETGSGKSTLVDILMGLLLPESGSFAVDKELINITNQYLWRRSVVHVPQNIFLSDVSILENIAFGHSAETVNWDSIKTAAKKASIHDHIESLEHGYNTIVGERGVKLSGGQRQRIGIARALYRSPDILFLDEATNALDDETEAKIMESIYQLHPKLTLIMVAHRKTTLKHCSIIIELDKGTIKKMGNYKDMIGS